MGPIKRMTNRTTETDLITLRPFTREDFARLISWVPTEADLAQWCAAFFKYPLTDAQLERYLESARQPNSRLIFTAFSAEDEGIGHIEISQIWPHLSTRLSRILVAPGQRRRGVASGMVAQALMTSFEQCFVDRVDLGVSAGNLAAIDCYLKLGFRRVGTWSNAILTATGNVDVVWMTVTRDVWAPRGRAR
jgi:RimJ/RimL family protein N-acetyltransferase